MRSKTLILHDERREDFDRLAAGWRAEYGGEGQATESMLERVILWDWFLKRAERRYIELECELAGVNPCDWTEEDHRQIELCLRYKTSHERSFFRAFYALRALRKEKIREEMAFDKVQALMNGMAREILEKATSEQEPKVEAKTSAKREAELETKTSAKREAALETKTSAEREAALETKTSAKREAESAAATAEQRERVSGSDKAGAQSGGVQELKKQPVTAERWLENLADFSSNSV